MGFCWSTGRKGMDINLFNGLGYLNRLQGNLSSTETVNLLMWERRHHYLYWLTLNYDCMYYLG